MQRFGRYTLAMFCWSAFWSAASADDRAANSIKAAGVVASLLDREPKSLDHWQDNRTKLRRWLRGRLGSPAQTKTSSVRVADHIEGHNCFLDILETPLPERSSSKTRQAYLLVPKDHVGRGPAVVYFSQDAAILVNENKPSPLSRREAEIAEGLIEVGFVVMVVFKDYRLETPGKEKPWEQTKKSVHNDLLLWKYLLERREVDPERVAVFGVGPEARRAWWQAALDDDVAAIVSVEPFSSGQFKSLSNDARLEAQALASLLAPRPHLLRTHSAKDVSRSVDADSPVERFRRSQKRMYRLYGLKFLFHENVSPRPWSPSSQTFEQTLRWLKEEL